MKGLQKVTRSISQLRRDVKATIKELNGQAARKVAQGGYGAAQQLVDLAVAVKQFAISAEELEQRWRAIKEKPKAAPRLEKTPVWEFYRLIARALVSMSGDGASEDVIDWISKNAVDELKPGDLAEGPKGEHLWRRAVVKAKRAMVKEGFLEPSGKNWKLTKSGKNLGALSG